jgi:hypothetical protein
LASASEFQDDNRTPVLECIENADAAEQQTQRWAHVIATANPLSSAPGKTVAIALPRLLSPG